MTKLSVGGEAERKERKFERDVLEKKKKVEGKGFQMRFGDSLQEAFDYLTGATLSLPCTFVGLCCWFCQGELFFFAYFLLVLLKNIYRNNKKKSNSQSKLTLRNG